MAGPSFKKEFRSRKTSCKRKGEDPHAAPPSCLSRFRLARSRTTHSSSRGTRGLHYIVNMTHSQDSLPMFMEGEVKG